MRIRAIRHLIRPTLALAVLASASAVVVSRSVPSPRPRKVPVQHGPVLISPPRRGSPDLATVWMEGDSGRALRLPAPQGRLLEFGVCSPWRDEAGGVQVAGRLACGENDPSPGCVGLARVSFPDGRLLDFVATDLPPMSPPCWSPGSRPEVIFAAGDGHLYRYAFEAEKPGIAGRGAHDAGPRRLAWNAPSPGGRGVFLSHPCWPPEHRFDRVLLVVIKPLRGSGREATFAGDQLWWVRLDEAGDAIVEAGLLLDPSGRPGDRALHSPVAGRTADGGVSLAYLSTARARPGGWDLRVAPLSFDGSGRPRALAGPGTMLAGRYSTDLPPVFSTDGRYVRVLRAGDDGRGRLVRVPLPEPDATAPILGVGEALATRTR